MQEATKKKYLELASGLRAVAEDVRGDEPRLIVFTAAREFERIAQAARAEDRLTRVRPAEI